LQASSIGHNDVLEALVSSSRVTVMGQLPTPSVGHYQGPNLGSEEGSNAGCT